MLIVVSDIFGSTKEFKSLAGELSPEAVVVDPYNGRLMEFESESAAYDHFMGRVGLDAYTAKVVEAISEASHQSVSLLGFSIGATAVWRATAGSLGGNIREAFCFYGSQIRNNLDLKPQCDVRMVLPTKEPNFSVECFKEEVVNIPGVEVLSTPYLHGFMNPHSKNYSQSGAKKYGQWLRSRLNKSVIV